MDLCRTQTTHRPVENIRINAAKQEAMVICEACNGSIPVICPSLYPRSGEKNNNTPATLAPRTRGTMLPMLGG